MLLQLVITSLLLVAGRASVLQGLEKISILQGLEKIIYMGGSYPDDRQHAEVSGNSEVIGAPLSSGAPTADYPWHAHWVFAQRGQVPYGALPANQDWPGQERLYVARAHHEGSMIPGKLVSSHGHAYVSWGNREFSKQQYEVLVGGSDRWVHTRGSHIPRDARPGGESERGELLYICRVYHVDGITMGKAQQSQGLCYVPWGGRELRFSEYEILLA